MAKEMTFFSKGTDSKLPAFMQNREAPNVMDNMMGSQYSTPNISLRGMRFRFRKGKDELEIYPKDVLPVIILGAVAKGFQRVWFEGSYDPNNPAPPACQSIDGIKPIPNSPKPQSETCQGCRRNEKNAVKPDGSMGRECGFSKRILVYAPEVSNDIWVMDLKGMSIFGNDRDKEGYTGYKLFTSELASTGLQSYQLVTGIKFDLNASVPKVMLKLLGHVTDEGTYNKTLELLNSDEYEELINMRDVTSAMPEKVAAEVAETVENDNYEGSTDNAQPEGAEATTTEDDGFNEAALDEAMQAR